MIFLLPDESTKRMQEDVSTPGKLCTVTFETTLGAHYVFPDVGLSEMECVVNALPHHSGLLTLANISQACLVLPTRIIKTFCIDGVERWRRPE